MHALTPALIGAASALAHAGSLQTIVVDFDDQPGGIPPLVTDGLFSDHVTFSTEADNILMIFSGAGFVGGSSPNTLTAGVSTTALNFDADIYMDFDLAAQNVSLDILSDNNTGVIAALQVFHDAGSSTVDVIGDGDIATPITADLSTYTGVTRVELTGINDEFGLSIDNLRFDIIPAPAPLALLAIAPLAALRRRR